MSRQGGALGWPLPPQSRLATLLNQPFILALCVTGALVASAYTKDRWPIGAAVVLYAISIIIKAYHLDRPTVAIRLHGPKFSRPIPNDYTSFVPFFRTPRLRHGGSLIILPVTARHIGMTPSLLRAAGVLELANGDSYTMPTIWSLSSVDGDFWADICYEYLQLDVGEARDACVVMYSETPIDSWHSIRVTLHDERNARRNVTAVVSPFPVEAVPEVRV